MLVKPPWLVVFDLDGTLINSSLDLCLSVNAAMGHVGVSPLPHKVITGFIGDGASILVRRALGHSGAVDELQAEESEQQKRFESAFAFFLDFYREHKLDNTHLYDGVLLALETIRERRPELLLAILTNKPVHPSREICENLGIAPFFFANYGGNSFETKKPDPGGLLTLMTEAETLWQTKVPRVDAFDPSGVVMVGDTEIDVETARRAGVRSLGCRYGLAPQSLELAKPDLMCDSPTDWPRLLGL